MKWFMTLPLVFAAAGISGCGGGNSAPVAAGPISLTDEQAKAIASEDSRVQEEEGGAFLADQAKKSKKKKQK